MIAQLFTAGTFAAASDKEVTVHPHGHHIYLREIFFICFPYIIIFLFDEIYIILK